MKSLLSIIISVLVVNVVIAQPHGESPLNATTAGKFAKDLGKKIYNTEPTYGDKQTGYNLNIIDWKPTPHDREKFYYLIKVEIQWQEGMGGLGGDWKKVYYKGFIFTDQYGCGTIFFISEKKEPSVLGLFKRASELSDDRKAIMSSIDPWLEGVGYTWAPEGCLEE